MRADAQANRDALISAATRQIAEHGVDVPFSSIAEEAEVGIATLYRNFPTRDDLVFAVLEAFRDQVKEIVDRCSPLLDENLPAGWDMFARQLADLRPGALVTAFAAEFVFGDQVSEELQKQRTDFIANVQEIVNKAVSAGIVRPDLTAIDFQMGIASITRPLPNVGVPDRSDHQQWLIDVYLNGLRPR